MNEQDHGQGSADAPVTLVQYGDYECPYTRRATTVVKALQQQLGMQVRFVFRNFPLTKIHPHALHSAEAAEAAAAQGKFWEMRDSIFNHQHTLEDADLRHFAEALDLDVGQFEYDMAHHQHLRRIEADVESGIQSGVQGTPTFYIDGVRHDGSWEHAALFAAIQPDFSYLAPQAAGYSWYPNSFLAPLASNEPHLTSAQEIIASLLAQAVDAGIEPERIILFGFSQGACLALEFAARHARRYGGVAGLSGGLIGPDGTPRNYPGAFDGTPMFLGCSNRDFHIPKERVEYSAQVLQRMGGQVTARLYSNMGHTINQDEIHAVQAMMAAM